MYRYRDAHSTQRTRTDDDSGKASIRCDILLVDVIVVAVFVVVCVGVVVVGGVGDIGDDDCGGVGGGEATKVVSVSVALGQLWGCGGDLLELVIISLMTNSDFQHDEWWMCQWLLVIVLGMGRQLEAGIRI